MVNCVPVLHNYVCLLSNVMNEITIHSLHVRVYTCTRSFITLCVFAAKGVVGSMIYSYTYEICILSHGLGFY